MGSVKHPRLQAYEDVVAAVRGCRLGFDAPSQKYQTMYDATIASVIGDIRNWMNAAVQTKKRRDYLDATASSVNRLASENGDTPADG